jgi:hypothetical protein
VVLLVIGLQPLQDLHRILDRGLVDVDLLETPDECTVFFEIIAVFLIGGRTDATQRAAGQGGLQQIGGIHCPAAGSAGADHGVDFVDEKDGALFRLEFADNGFEPLLEIAAIAGSGKERAHVEGENGGVREHIRHLAADNAQGEAFGNGGLADARVADIERIILRPAAENLDRPLDLGLAADQGIDLALDRLLVEVDTVILERIAAAFDDLLGARILVSTADAPALRTSRHLGNAVRDVVDRIEPAHLLLLQEIDGMRFSFGEHRHQHIGPGYLFTAGGLDVDGGSLQHPLEACRGLGVVDMSGGEVGQFVLDIFRQFPPQALRIDPTRAQDRQSVLVLGQGQEQMLQRREFMAPAIGVGQGAMKCLF